MVSQLAQEMTMLDLVTQQHRFPSGVTRRNFVKAGFLGLGAGLTMGELLHQQATAASIGGPGAGTWTCV